jgi:15-cis-phytoene desaturase
VYKAKPGCQAHRPSQTTPIPNFFLTGDFTMQRYLASMEGAILSGKLTAEAINQQPPNQTAQPTRTSDRTIAARATA